MAKYYHPDTDTFRKLGMPIPKSFAHGTDEDIRSKLKPMQFKNWHTEGNLLIGDGPEGRMVQKIPTNYICKGTDDRGLPILEKIVI